MNPDEITNLDALMHGFDDYYHRKLSLESFLRIFNNLIGVATVIVAVLALVSSKQLPNGKLDLEMKYQITIVTLIVVFASIWLWQSFYHIPWFLNRWVKAHITALDKTAFMSYQTLLTKERLDNQSALKELQRERVGVDSQLDKLLSAPYQQLVDKQRSVVERLRIIKKMSLYF